MRTRNGIQSHNPVELFFAAGDFLSYFGNDTCQRARRRPPRTVSACAHFTHTKSLASHYQKTHFLENGADEDGGK